MDIICGCFNITKDQIVEAIRNGATTIEEVGEATSAGTACGACRDEIQRIISETSKEGQ